MIEEKWRYAVRKSPGLTRAEFQDEFSDEQSEAEETVGEDDAKIIAAVHALAEQPPPERGVKIQISEKRPVQELNFEAWKEGCLLNSPNVVDRQKGEFHGDTQARLTCLQFPRSEKHEWYQKANLQQPVDRQRRQIVKCAFNSCKYHTEGYAMVAVEPLATDAGMAMEVLSPEQQEQLLNPASAAIRQQEQFKRDGVDSKEVANDITVRTNGRVMWLTKAARDVDSGGVYQCDEADHLFWTDTSLENQSFDDREIRTLACRQQTFVLGQRRSKHGGEILPGLIELTVG